MRFTLCLAVLLSSVAGVSAQSLSGLSDATVKFDNFSVPFPIEFSQNGSEVAASFFNGDDRITSTSGSLTSSTVTVNFDHYGTQLKATLTGAELKGSYGGARNGFHDFEARPHQEITSANIQAPDISGVWYMANESAKGEHAWRLIVKQKGSYASASILNVEGDTGALVGGYQDGKFVLNHFDGARASILELTPKPDGTIGVIWKPINQPALHLLAVSLSDAVDDGLPQPTDPDDHTHVRNSEEPFRFHFPDLEGKIVTNRDRRFKDKVVIVNITSSLYPTCHDEAPFLEELYRKYHSRGLDIVALDFEEPEQLKNPTRLRALIKKYRLEYIYLLAGQPEDLQARLPQAVNLNSWPTTFFLGRDGKVRAIHAGFASSATGAFNIALKRNMTERVEQLLSEGVRAAR